MTKNEHGAVVGLLEGLQAYFAAKKAVDYANMLHSMITAAKMHAPKEAPHG